MKARNERIALCLIGLAVLVAVLAFVGDQAWNRHKIAAAKQLWQNKMKNAHLIGANQSAVFTYLTSNGLIPENTHGWFDYDQSPSQVKAGGVNQFGPTYSAIVFPVADTLEPLPLNWMIDIDLQIDKHGKLLFYEVKPDCSGI